MIAQTRDPHTEPRWGSSALVTIDAQRDVLPGGPFEVVGIPALTAIAAAARTARAAGRPVIHAVRLYLADGNNADLCRRTRIEGGWRALIPGSEGSQLAAELLPDAGVCLDHERLLAGEVQVIGPGEAVIYKPRWGAFFGTALDHHLRDLAVDTLAFCGANFPNCPRASIYEASERDYRNVLLIDATSGVDARDVAELAAIGVGALPVAEYARAVRAIADGRAPQ